MAGKTTRVTIDKSKRFSQSIIWDMQRGYFSKEGVDAWVKEVPFYATSNPFLAGCYANMAIRFIQEWVRKHPESKQHPFYIVELGAGSGILAFHTLNRMQRLIKRLHLEDVDIRYVLTDYAERNLKFWDNHPGLQKYFESNKLDIATYNMEGDTQIELRKSKDILGPGSVKNPMVVFANYIFDTVSQDAFAMRDGRLYSALVNVSTEKDNMEDGKPIDMEKMHIEYHTMPVEENYYEDPDINATLHHYKKSNLKRSYFLFPTAGLITLQNLRKISGGKLFLVSTDKAYAYISQLENLSTPDIAFHGSFSTMVNFHAIAQYFELLGGKAILQTQRAEVTTAGFVCGFEKEELPEFDMALYENIERLSPGDYFALHRNIRENVKHCNINTLAAHMAFADWDPHIFGKISKVLLSLLPDAERETKIYLANHMPELASNYYYMPHIYDVWFDIGVVLHTLRHYEDAIHYYQQSMHFYGVQFNTLYNLAICQQNAGKLEDALATFRQAVELNDESSEAKDWIEHIEKELAKKKK
ncbi:MAG: SAM-dependent methyltransferase [Gammaproteobacteria bacterium]